MRWLRSKKLQYSVLFLTGITWVALGYQWHQYAQLVETGNQAVLDKRFDSQAYEQAKTFWFAERETLLLNQGVLTYAAGKLPYALEHFRHVAQHSHNDRIRTHALYNLGMVLLALDDAKGAEEFFKATLRLDPHDRQAKLVLEQLYHTLLQQSGNQRQATYKRGPGGERDSGAPLKQAPGLSQERSESAPGDGLGRSQSSGGI